MGDRATVGCGNGTTDGGATLSYEWGRYANGATTGNDSDDVIIAHLQNCDSDDETAWMAVDGDDNMIADGTAADGVTVNVERHAFVKKKRS